MKTTFKFIIAAMAAGAVLSSCQKEMAIDNTASSTDGVRVISASFSAPTKSTLNGKTPKFVGGEEIKVSNATESQVRTISIDASGNAYFSTTLSGTLTAVYPSTAAEMKGDVIDETTVLVSTVQEGTFASANIAMATGITTSATFTNKTAVIAITPGEGSNSKYVEVITAGPEIANSTSGAYSKKNKIHVNVNSATTYPVYVSILVPSGLKVKNLSFADGKNIKTAKDNTTAIAVNTINTVSNTGWNTPYVEINGLKWATMNIGATNETEAGKYFMWGETTGITPIDSSFSFPNSKYYSADNDSWDSSKGFAWENFPHTKGIYVGSGESKKLNVFTKYTTNSNYAYSGTADGLSILESADDAATSNWGGSWRMPTCGMSEGDFNDLLKAFDASNGKMTPTSGGGTETKNKGVYWCENYSGKKGVLFIAENNGTPLFFPAAGHGDGVKLQGETTAHSGYYLSSTSGNATFAMCLYIGKEENKVEAGGSQKYFGWSVRPVSD